MSAKRLLTLRVLLKVMAWIALLVVFWFSFRYFFSPPEQIKLGDKSIPVQALANGQMLTTDWDGREVLVLRKSASEFLVVYRRSPEFSCLLQLVNIDSEKMLQDPCTDDLFDLEGKVLPDQRAVRDLQPLDYRLGNNERLILSY